MSVLNAVLQTLNSLKFDNSSIDGFNISESENLEASERIRIFNSLPTLASNLGPTDTRQKLIPILEVLISNAIDAGDDEVLLVISKKLIGFAEFVGGKEHTACILPLLDKIACSVEEVVVADAACDALVDLVPYLPAEVIDDKCNKLIHRLLNDDNYCANRKVAPRLIVACYPHVSSKRQCELNCNLIHLADSDDETPLVRSAAVQQLTSLAKLVGPAFKSALILVLESLVSDHQRIVRAACVGPMVEWCQFITDPAEYESVARPLIDKLIIDNSRETRRALASSITDLQANYNRIMGSSTTSPTAAPAQATGTGNKRSLDEAMLSLLEDNEAETRRIAATKFREFCLAAPKDVLAETLLPKLREHLCMEREETVKAELIRCAVKMLPSIRREEALPLVQHILAFLNEGSQSKQYVFEHFLDLTSLMPISEIQLTLLPSLLRLWQDRNWRVRLGIVQSIPQLYPSLPESCLRETLLPANLAWLRDPSWYVRDCACRGLARLLRACPNACKEAVNGVGAKLASAAATAIGGPPTIQPPGTPQQPTASSPAAAATSSDAAATPNTPATANQQQPASPSQPLVAAASTIHSITCQAAQGGLKALAVDSNYHFRQIFITVVHSLWGPGIPQEAAFNACGGDEPAAGRQSLLSPVKRSSSSASANAATNGLNHCEAPPQLPAPFLSICLTLLLQLCAEDSIANVRIAGCRALLIIAKSIDKKVIQKDVIPVLKKIADGDSDVDARYYAQETLNALTAIKHKKCASLLSIEDELHVCLSKKTT